MGTIGELIRWLGIALHALGAGVARRCRALRARLLQRDVVVAGSERRFRALLESAPDSIVLIDWHGHIQLVNAQTERVFGYARNELIGQPVSRLVPDRMRAAGRAQFRAFIKDPQTQGVRGEDLFGLRADGTEFPVEISLGALETDRGLLISAMIRDVTDRRRAEATLREAEAEEHFRIAFEEAPVGIALAGLDFRLLRVNHALCEITGHSREHLETIRLGGLLDAEDPGTDPATIDALLSGEIRRHRAERLFAHATGRRLPVDVSAALVLGPDGRPHHLLVQVNDITDRKRVEGQLQHLADHDPLTGLFNRRRFEHALAEIIGRAEQGAVLAIDLDHFKLVNDTLGHRVGDELIVKIATLIGQRLRATDTLARLGGDEFAVILPGADAPAARAVADELLSVLRAESRDADPGSAIRWVTASVGIAPIGEGSTTAEQTLIEADIAMYDAKEAGRNRVAVYDAASRRQGRMQEHLTWADRIRSALAEDRFVLHAQAIASLSSDPTPRYELLIRMLGDDGEPIAPGEFLGLAERIELIQAIDRWVVRRAVAALARERHAGREIMLAVNLSAKSVIDPGMPAFIAAALGEAGIDGRGLCLELTETATVEHVDRAQRFAEAMSDLGCEFALDDFGAGFASFYHLKHLVFDHLKIDGEFIRDLPHSRVNQLVVQSVVSIAKGLGKQTIAEFVGDAETVELLREYGVDFAQGFHIGRPTPLDALDLAAFPAESSILG